MKIYAISTANSGNGIELNTMLFKTRKDAEKQFENEKNELIENLEEDEIQFDEDEEKDYYEVVSEEGDRYLIRLFEFNI